MKLGKSVLNYPVVKFAFTDEEIARMANEADYLEKENKRNLDEMYTADKPDALKLRDHLLAASGTNVKIDQETDFGYLLEKGEFYSETYMIIPVKKRRDSFEICSEIWAEHPDKYSVVSGFALGHNGIWRSHDWLVDKDNNVFEVTREPRSLYFGAIDEDQTLST
jgi:hypothetical protein